MNSLDFLHYSTGVGVLILVVVIAYGVWQLVLTLKSIRRILFDVKSLTRDVRVAKNSVKFGLFTVLKNLSKARR